MDIFDIYTKGFQLIVRALDAVEIKDWNFYPEKRQITFLYQKERYVVEFEDFDIGNLKNVFHIEKDGCCESNAISDLIKISIIKQVNYDFLEEDYSNKTSLLQK